MPIVLQEHAVIAGRFRLNHPIGRGGMGSVWHATHLGLDIPCAVKFIEGEHAAMAEAQTRFEREAKAAAVLRSPHVVQILDHGVCDGTPYIAMELLEGEDLGKRLQKVGKLSPRDTHGIVMQVCRALSKAHALGIVHRDLKPDNIFLVRDDDREIAKVLDFGIAKREENALQGSNTKTGAMLGTPYYMSPEQAQGIKTVDFRSDLWSLGVIVYQCVTGLLPFESEALGDLLMRIIVNPLPVPSRVADVPAGFDAWWARVASREPTARFQSAKDFADSLGIVCGISHGGVTEHGEIHPAAGHAPEPGALGMATPRGGGSARALSSTPGGSVVQTHTYGDDPTPRAPRGARSLGLMAGAGALVVAGVVAAWMLAPWAKPSPAASTSGLPQAEAVVPTGSAPPAREAPATESATLAPSPPELAPAEPAHATTTQSPKPAATHIAKGSGAKPAPTKLAPSPAAPKGDLGF